MRGSSLLWLVLLATGCVPEVCARAEALNTSFPQRHAACIAEGTLTGPAFDGAACDGSMSTCSASDEQALQAYFQCVEKLPACTRETRADFSQAFLSCA